LSCAGEERQRLEPGAALVPLAPAPLLLQAGTGCGPGALAGIWELGLLPAPCPQHSRGGCDAEVHIDAQPQPGVGDE